MTEIIFHRSRMPGESDIFEVKTSNTVGYTGHFYFQKVEDNVCKLVEVEMRGECDKEDYITEAAEALIREKDQKIVYDVEADVIAELSIGGGYWDDE